jgi:hypothetical protein
LPQTLIYFYLELVVYLSPVRASPEGNLPEMNLNMGKIKDAKIS